MDLRKDEDLKLMIDFHLMKIKVEEKRLSNLSSDQIFGKCMYGSASEYRRVLSNIQSCLTKSEDYKLVEFAENLRRIENGFKDKHQLVFYCLELIENTILKK